MKTIKIIIWGSVLIILHLQTLLSQTLNGKETRMVQVTFAYPVGSAGSSSVNYTNNFSLNILYGLNGGVNGFEFGSLWNHNEGEVKWMQIAGLANTTAGNSLGLMISGIANINRGTVVGAGISGVLNYSHKYLSGVHIAGVSNIAPDSLNGVFVSGILNLTKGSAKGIQMSTVNLASDFEGIQLGVINHSKRLKGFQLGVVNIIDEESEKALPLGLITVVKNGYYEFDLTAGEAIYSNLNFKMGVERLYTIFKAGYSGYQKKPVYSFGWGVGTGIFLSDRQRLNIELSRNQICYDYNWKVENNHLNKLDLNYRFYVMNNLSFMVGPSFNIYVTGEKVNGEYGTINIPYTLSEREYAYKKLFSWIGFNAGISIKL